MYPFRAPSKEPVRLVKSVTLLVLLMVAAPTTIQRFQNRAREAFLSGDRGTARVYLQNLVDHIVIGEEEIVIEAKAGAALAMMAASRPAASESTSGEVLADVVDWRTP